MSRSRRRSAPAAPDTPQPLAAHCPVPAVTPSVATPGSVQSTTGNSGVSSALTSLLGPAPTTTPSYLATPASAQSNPLVRQTSPAARVPGAQERSVGGVRVTGNNISPTAMDATERMLNALTGHREDIRERLAEADTRVIVVSSEEALTDVPELSHLRNTLTTDGCRHWQDVRGSGGTQVGDEWVVSVPEENLVETTTGRPDEYRGDHSVGVHELAHTVLLKGVSSAERRRVDALYAAQRGSDFTDTYAASNRDEYFAQSTGAFLGLIADEGPEWLQLHDPDMYALLETIYGTPEEALARAGGPEPEAPEAAAPAAPAVS
ncbi:MAG: hypothetical protein R3F61_37650 [Myxococcota bacterium]